MGPFQYDNPLMAAMVRIANMMIVSFFWVVCCLPVITVVPATAALYHSTIKVIRGNGNGIAGVFFRSFRDAVGKGILLSVIFLGTGILFGFSLWYGWQMREDSWFGAIYFLIGCFIIFFWSIALLHLPFALSRFEGKLGMYIRMAVYFSTKNIFKTVLRFILLVIVVMLVDFYPIVLLLLPGLYMDLISGGVEKQLQQFMDENGLSTRAEADSGQEEDALTGAVSMPSLEMASLYGDKEDGGDQRGQINE